MNQRLEQNRKFQESLGAFIIAFSELEHGLAELSFMTTENLKNSKHHLAEHLGLTIDIKIKNISRYINLNIPELKEIWDEQKSKIKSLNEDRRYLAHGFIQYFLPFSDGIVPTYIRKKIGKEKYKIEKKNFTPEILFKLTDQIHHLKSGKNGIKGEFSTLFITKRINIWNLTAQNNDKIIYRVNGIILSDFKGK